jgi:hypothetical protein
VLRSVPFRGWRERSNCSLILYKTLTTRIDKTLKKRDRAANRR